MKPFLITASLVLAFLGLMGLHMRVSGVKLSAEAEPPKVSAIFTVVEELTPIPGLHASVGVFRDRGTGDDYIVVIRGNSVSVTRREPLTTAGNPAEREP